jgi:hypothetical protein
MNYRLKFLKVKIKSLAAEQGIIRLEKRRALKAKNYPLVDELNNHRVRAVRPEARAALMAYGLLRGRLPEAIEPGAKSEPDQARVTALIKKYGTIEDRSKLLAA